jgi:superfamily II DNA or RNA helicase
LEGQYPLQKVKKITSFYVKGFQFAPAFKKKRWDGRKHLFSVARKSMPAGLVPLVVKELKNYNKTAKIRIIDRREDSVPVVGNNGFDLHGVKFEGKFDYQLEAAQAMVAERRGILKMATNSGKCLAPDTLVLKHNGHRVRADQVQVGDCLAGPTGPRTVLSITAGKDVMYEIRANQGDATFQCNSVHVLTIYDSRQKQVVDVPLNEFLTWPKDRRRLARLVYADVVEFPPLKETCPVDPWLTGLWFADGRKDLSFVEITKPDKEISDALRICAKDQGLELKVQQSPDHCPSWRFVRPGAGGRANPILTGLRLLYGDGTRLPRRLLHGTLGERRAFLAGIIDGDGYSDGVAVEVVWKHHRWALDLQYLARSLGFRTNFSKKRVRLPQWDEPRTYWRVMMSGDTSQLPLRLARKYACAKRRTGFTVTRWGHDKYAGFTLDGDGRFILGNFLVTHNSEVAIAVTKHLAIPTLFLVERLELLHQTRKRFSTRLGISLDDIGVVGDGQYQIGKWVTIATPASLATRIKKNKALPQLWQMVISDEAHHCGADTFYDVLDSLSAYYRFGMSGTPLNRSDGADLRLIAQTGPVLYDVSNKLLVERGISVQPHVEMVKIDKPIIPPKTAWGVVQKLGVTENATLNRKVVEKALENIGNGEQVLILVDTIKHGDTLDKMMWLAGGAANCGFSTHHQFINGKEDTTTRLKALEDFQNQTIKCLIATSILDEGVDIPNIDVLILAAGGKSKIRLLQRAGRGLRTDEGKDRLLIIDFANFTHKYLLKHSLQRLQTYKAEDCFMISTG